MILIVLGRVDCMNYSYIAGFRTRRILWEYYKGWYKFWSAISNMWIGLVNYVLFSAQNEVVFWWNVLWIYLMIPSGGQNAFGSLLVARTWWRSRASQKISYDSAKLKFFSLSSSFAYFSPFLLENIKIYL